VDSFSIFWGGVCGLAGTKFTAVSLRFLRLSKRGKNVAAATGEGDDRL